MVEEAQQSHRSLAEVIEELPNFQDPAAAVLDIAQSLAFAEDISQAAAEAQAKAILQAKGPQVIGATTTAVHQWRFHDESFYWHTKSDDKKIQRLASSMLRGGFLQDEPVTPRFNDMSAIQDSGLFSGGLVSGGGQARLLAAKLAWHVSQGVVSRLGLLPGIASVRAVWSSLLAIPTVFEQHLTEEDAMLSSSIKQNVRAQMSEQLHTLDWVVLTMKLAQAPLDGTPDQQRRLQKMFDGRAAGRKIIRCMSLRSLL